MQLVCSQCATTAESDDASATIIALTFSAHRQKAVDKQTIDRHMSSLAFDNLGNWEVFQTFCKKIQLLS